MNITKSDMQNFQFDMIKLNVRDEFKNLTIEEVKNNLKKYRSNYVTCFENIIGDMNLSVAIRNNNAFAGESVLVLGRRQFDRRGSVGTHHYEDIVFGKDLLNITDKYHAWTPRNSIDCLEIYRKKGYQIVAADCNTKFPCEELNTFAWPAKVVVVFGEEKSGISEEILTYADSIVYIRQKGSVRSLNVGTTSGIFLYSYEDYWR